jgi:hypothetical protein
MMKLLTPTRPADLPTDALLARLRCRRAAIDLAANHATEAPVADAVGWIYQRLNTRLRKQLEPVLDLLAMRNLILTLRYSLAGEPPPATVLSNSLLAEPLKRLTTATEEAETTVAQLEAILDKDYPFITGLATTYRNQGPGGVEQQLTGGILQHGLTRAGSKILKRTLRYLIDMRNCLMIHKLWRWQVGQAPPLIAGGLVAATSLQRIWATHDSERLSRLTSRLAGEPLISTETIGMEQSLLNGLTRLLRRAGRDPLGLAVVIEYLWRAQLAVHNQDLRQALAPDREELLAEVLLL